MLIIRDGRFVRGDGTPYTPILVASVKPNWIFGGDYCYHTAEKAGAVALVREHYNEKLRRYLLAAWGPDAIFAGLTSPVVSSQLGLPALGQFTEGIIRHDRLRTPIVENELADKAAELFDAHPRLVGWNVVEPAWEALAAGVTPSMVAEQILTITRALRSAAPGLPIFWNECGVYSTRRNFTRATFGEVLRAVIRSGHGPEILGADSYPTHPEQWDGPSWWPLLHDADGQPSEGAPILGISETGWQPNGTIDPHWDEKRAARLGVIPPTKADREQYSPVPGADQPSAYRECFRRWVTFNRKAISEYGARFISWHSACGHRQKSGGYIPWGPIDPLTGYWHPPEEVRAAVDLSTGV